MQKAKNNCNVCQKEFTTGNPHIEVCLKCSSILKKLPKIIGKYCTCYSTKNNRNCVACLICKEIFGEKHGCMYDCKHNSNTQ